MYRPQVSRVMLDLSSLLTILLSGAGVYSVGLEIAQSKPMMAPEIIPDQGVAVIPHVLPEHLPK